MFETKSNEQKKEEREKQNPFLKWEWLKELEKEGLTDRWYYGLGNEQKRYSLCIHMINEGGCQRTYQKQNITIENFKQEFHEFAKRMILPKVQVMTEKMVTFDKLFCSEDSLGLNPNQTAFIINIVLRWLRNKNFCNAIPCLGISLYINLKKNEYGIFLDSNKVVVCSLDKNCVGLLYSLIAKEICIYESLDIESKIKHFMKKLSIRCDFTKRQCSYQINSHHLVIGKKCKKQALLEILETKNTNTLRVLFQYFSIISIYSRRIIPFLSMNRAYSKYTDYKEGRTIFKRIDSNGDFMSHHGFLCKIGDEWKYSKVNRKSQDLFYLLDIEIADFLKILCPAPVPYLVKKLHTLDGVEMIIKGEEIVFLTDFLAPMFRCAGILEHVILGAYEEEVFFMRDNSKKYECYVAMKNKGWRRYNARYALVY